MKKSKKLISLVLSLLMVLSCFSGMGLTAFAGEASPYADLKNTTTVITFDNKQWYMIEDNSTSATEGTVTLLSKECVGASAFDPDGSSNTYSGSTVESFVNNWYSDNITSDAKAAVNGSGMFLLTTDQANGLSSDVLKCTQASGAEMNFWWLCSPGTSDEDCGVMGVYGEDGEDVTECSVVWVFGVRPALQLDLSKVEFDSSTYTFALSTATPAEDGPLVGTVIKVGDTLTLDGDYIECMPGVSDQVTESLKLERMEYDDYFNAWGAVFEESFAFLVAGDKTPEPDGFYFSGGNGTQSHPYTLALHYASAEPASSAYAGYLPAEADDATALAAKVVKFNGYDWYLIEDNSTSETEGTVTLFAKDKIGSSRFDNSSNVYSGSMVKSYLDNLTAEGGAFADVADAIVSTDLEDVTVTGAKLWLLSKDEVITTYKLSTALNKCSNDWWLRTPVTSSYVIYVNGESGSVVNTGNFHMNTYGVRPALNLDLSKVEFDSETKTFAVPTPSAYAGYLPAEADDATALAAKVVKFNGMDWYLIEDNSTSETEGTVTLFAKECVGASAFGTNNTYSGSTVETYVNNWYTSNISADAKAAVDGNGMFLLTSDQASALSSDVRKCSEVSGAEYNHWWLCTPFSYYQEVMVVDGDNGVVRDGVDDGTNVEDTLGVRPALKLDLSKVEFDSSSKTFAVPHIHDGITFTAWTSTNSLPTDGGNYYLTNDVLLENVWNVPNAEVNLCLDGHSITAAEGKEIQLMDVENGATLNLYDKEDNSGSISGAVSVNGAILVNSGTFNMYGGTIKDNMTTDHGAGVRVKNGGTFSLYGGSIENNKTKNQGGYGGGVHVETNSTFNMSGGSIKNNTAFSCAGVFIGTNCTFNMSGGSITGNTATNGDGGVLFTDDGTATFKLSGDVTISDNVTKIDIEEIGVHETYPSNMVIPDSVTIEVVDALTGEGKIYVQIGTSRVFTNSTGSVKAKDYIDKFVSDSATYRIRTEGDELKIEAPYLRVGGTFVYDDNAADVFKDGKVKFTPANETTTYATLTLNGYQYDGTADDDSEGIIYLDPAQLRIVLQGENIVKATNPGIMINRGADTIISSENGGSLEVVSKQGDAIYANGALTVESGTIIATGANRGIAAKGINLNGGRIVATGTGTNGYGIYCESLPWLPATSVSINGGITSLIASGTLGAVYGDVANALEGLGWSNITGTDGRETIAVTTEARSLGYKKVAFVSHTHDFTYATGANAIIAECTADGCPLDDGTEQHNHIIALNIVAPTLTTYGQTGEGISAEATLDGLDAFNAATGLNVAATDIKYYEAEELIPGFTRPGEELDGAPTDTGSYFAGITISNVKINETDTSNVSAYVSYTIAKADPTCTAPTGLTATYGQTLANVTLPEGWAWANTGTSVGIVGTRTFKAIFTPNDTANYNVVYNIDVTVTVNKANPTYTVPTGLEATYGDTLSSVTLPTGWSWVNGSQKVGNADTKTFKATYTPTDTTNYNVVNNVDVTVTVNKADINPTVTLDGWTYGEAANTPVVTGNTGDGHVTYTYAVKGSDEFSETVPTDANTYTVKATIAATTNYNGKTVTADFTIAKANPTANDFAFSEPDNLNYDGNNKTATVVPQDGVDGMGDATVKYYSDAARTNEVDYAKNAGTYYVGITVNEGDNYNATSAVLYNSSWKFTVAKADIEPTVTLEDWTYGEEAKTPVVTGNLGGGTVTITYAPANIRTSLFKEEVPTEAGDYIVRAEIAETDNYNGATAYSTFTIARADLEPTVTINDWVYGEEADKPVVEGNLGEGDVTFTYAVKGSEEFSELVPTEAGAYTVKAEIAETANYNEAVAYCDFAIIYNNGLVKDGEGNWHYYIDNEPQTGWVPTGKFMRFFDEDGIMVTGLQKIEGKWYYFKENQDKLGIMLTGFQQAGGYTRYFDPTTGVMATSGLTKIDGKWYFFNDTQPKLGAMFTGWKKFGNYMRYFATDGVMATGLTKATNGNWYYFNNSGIRQYGWVAFGKNYRYFDPSTGVMLANTKQTIGGKNYTFGANGICTNK